MSPAGEVKEDWKTSRKHSGISTSLSVAQRNMLTLRDLCDKLKRLDEVTLLEVLDISSEDIVDRFEDMIEEHYDQLEKELEDI